MAGENWSNEAFAARIDEARKEVQVPHPRTGKLVTLSQGELERRVGIAKPGQRGPGYIARIRKGERGESIRREWLVGFARELNVSLLWLAAGIGPKRLPEGAPPPGGRALGLYIAAIAGLPAEAIDAVAKELAGEEHANDEPLMVAGLVEIRAKMLRDRMSAQAAHARAGRDRGEAIAKEQRKAERRAATEEKKRAREASTHKAPRSRRPTGTHGV